jgi:hypothetical protein
MPVDRASRGRRVSKEQTQLECETDTPGISLCSHISHTFGSLLMQGILKLAMEAMKRQL